MLESVEKARKIISSTPDSNINIDYLLEEEDLNFNLKRDGFEKLIEPLTQRFNELLLATIAESGKYQIFGSLELSSRPACYGLAEFCFKTQSSCS